MLRRIGAGFLATTLMVGAVGVEVGAVQTRYSQNGKYSATGSPMLNGSFTIDQWNRWEMVAWGVFLSNFTIPMVDSYESAFSTSSTYGSRGSGFKALDFSQSGDPASKGILQDFTRFALDNSKQAQKELYVTYHYIDRTGNVIVDGVDGVVKADGSLDPTKQDIQPQVTSIASFNDLLPGTLALMDTEKKNKALEGDTQAWIVGLTSDDADDVFSKGSGVYINNGSSFGNDRWDMFSKESGFGSTTLSADTNMSKIALPPENSGGGTAKDSAVAKLPILWVKAQDESYIRVWDMLDPWDYQILTTMLGKEMTFEDGKWEEAQANLNRAYADDSSLSMDCFGNIVTNLDGNHIIVIPAAYNKHLTTKPMVNLVTSLVLGGATASISSNKLVMEGKAPVRNYWYAFSSDNTAATNKQSKFGPGLPAFGWEGSKIPSNAITLYYDSDTLLYKTFKDASESGTPMDYYTKAIEYGGVRLAPHVAALLGVFDLGIGDDENRQFIRGSAKEAIVPRLALQGISKKASEGFSGLTAEENSGVVAYMSLLTWQDPMVGVLPATYNESIVEYAQDLYSSSSSKVYKMLGKPVVVPVLTPAGEGFGDATDWDSLARDYMNFYGTEYYKANRELELVRLSKDTVDEDGTVGAGFYPIARFLRALMYTLNGSEGKDSLTPTAALLQHSGKGNIVKYMDTVGLLSPMGAVADGSWFKDALFEKLPWRIESYIAKERVDTSVIGIADTTDYLALGRRFVKAYTVNKALTREATYLAMRGGEYAAAAAPSVYLSYLDMYGIGSVDGSSGVGVSTLNSNPTKFNEKIYEPKSNPIFTFDIDDNDNIGDPGDIQKNIDKHVDLLLTTEPKGNAYKRELLNSTIGNWIYTTYTSIVYGETGNYRYGESGGIISRSQAGFLRFPSLEDNYFTSWFYGYYSELALGLLGIGLSLIAILGVLRGRKLTWYIMMSVTLMVSMVLVPLANDYASAVMDRAVNGILDDKTTVWSLSEFITNQRVEAEYLSVSEDSEETDILADLASRGGISTLYTDRTLMMKQDISHKLISLGNFGAYQKFASTRWMLPSIMRQYTAEDGSNDYLYIPLSDIVQDAANAYWWYNPVDAKYSMGVAAADTKAKSAVGTQLGSVRTLYTGSDLEKFYPNYHTTLSNSTEAEGSVDEKLRLSYRSLSQSYKPEGEEVGTYGVPIHDYIYMYMTNTVANPEDEAEEGKGRPQPLLPLRARLLVQVDVNDTNEKFWGDPRKVGVEYNIFGEITGKSLETNGGEGSYMAALNSEGRLDMGNAIYSNSYVGYDRGLTGINIIEESEDTGEGEIREETDRDTRSLTLAGAHLELFPLVQNYRHNERDTMSGEFPYLWSTETSYPYFYALVKDTMEAVGRYEYETGVVESTRAESEWDTKEGRRPMMLRGLLGTVKVKSKYYGTVRNTFMYQSGLVAEDLESPYFKGADPFVQEGMPIFTGLTRDVLDLESMFYNVIPYLYEMTLTTGGLVGETESDRGLYGGKNITASRYKVFEGLPESWLYRTNWVTKIVESKAYNKREKIGYYAPDGTKQVGTLSMSYLPDAYLAVGREMIFSEAQLEVSGLRETDLTVLELKCIEMNKRTVDKWTELLNYSQTEGITSEVLVRQMALDAMLEFNKGVTPNGLGNLAYHVLPNTVDLRSLSFDTIMRGILLSSVQNADYLDAGAMESTVLSLSVIAGLLLVATAALCVYIIPALRAAFLGVLFLAGILGVVWQTFSPLYKRKVLVYGYVTNIFFLYLMSMGYYWALSFMMRGSIKTSYIEVSRVVAATKVLNTPTVVVILTFLVSSAYVYGMYRLVKVIYEAIKNKSYDLGYSRYKDYVMSRYDKVADSMDKGATRVFKKYKSKRNKGNGEESGEGTGKGEGKGGGTEGKKTSKKDKEMSGAVTSKESKLGSKSKGKKQGTLDDSKSIDNTIDKEVSRGETKEIDSGEVIEVEDKEASKKK